MLWSHAIQVSRVVASHTGRSRDGLPYVGRTPAFGEVADTVVVPAISWTDLKGIPIPREDPVLDVRQPFIVMDRSLHLVVCHRTEAAVTPPGFATAEE